MGRVRPGVLVLALLAAVIVVARLHTYHEPLQTDITGAAVLAREMLGGRTLYADLWDHKPPAFHASYMIAVALLGCGPAAVYALNVLAAVATLVGVYVAGAALSRSAGLWAAAFWTVASSDVWLEANQPDAEVFVNAGIVWAFALLVRAGPGAGAGRFLAIGAFFALASLYKQVVIAPAALLALAHVAWPPEGRSRRRALADVAAIAVVGAAAWAATLGYFAAVGRLDAFWESVVVYNRFYTRNMLTFVGRAFDVYHAALEPGLRTLVLLGLPAAVGGLLAPLAIPRRPRRLWLALLLATPVAIGLHGQFFPHYFQLWFPVLVIGAGWAVEVLARLARERLALVPHALAGAVLVLLLAHALPLYALSADDWSVVKYGPLFVEERKLGREIDALLRPGETFYIWGSEVGLYYVSGRRLPSGAYSVWPIVDGPSAARLTRRAVADLRREQPELFVVSNWTQIWIKGRHPVLDWLAAHYRPFAGQDGRSPFTVHVRRGGRLEREADGAAAR